MLATTILHKINYSC